MAILADAHCHLNLLANEDEIMERCERVGVNYILNPGVTMTGVPSILRLVNKFDNVYGAIAVHPTEEVAFPTFEELYTSASSHQKIVALGETGLDFKDASTEDQKRQLALLELHLLVAKALKKPVILHLREASKELLAMVKQHQVVGMVHCFTDDWETAKAFLDLGFLLSFSGILTFKRSDCLRETFCRVPVSSILIETDAPFLAPEPMRGKTNEPAFILNTMNLGAELLGLEQDLFAKLTTDNFLRFIEGEL